MPPAQAAIGALTKSSHRVSICSASLLHRSGPRAGRQIPLNATSSQQSSESGEPSPGQYCYGFPRPALTVDAVVFAYHDSQLHVLLMRRGREPFRGNWAIPGGFVQMDEGLQVAAQRELAEETGVGDIYLEQFYTFGDPDRDPRTRTVSVAYMGLLNPRQFAAANLRADSDADEVRWWNMAGLPALAFDHDRILRFALQQLRWKLEWTALGYQFLPAEFALAEIRRLYETLLNQVLNPRAFRRRLLDRGLIEPAPGAGRARRYRFTAAAIEEEQARRRFP